MMMKSAAMAVRLSVLVFVGYCQALNGQELVNVVEQVQPKIVKIHGSGGFQGLEAYQSGFLISPDGHLVTAWSYVLDSDVVTVTLNDGQKFQAELVGYNPRMDIAVLKIPASDLAFFNIDDASSADIGTRILAFSNLYGVATGNEAVSVLHGIVSARCDLSARQGTVPTLYQGPVYILDAMTNNPGSAGGAVTDCHGGLVGIIGKELRHAQTNVWLNFAIPINDAANTIHDIRSGKMNLGQRSSRTVPGEPMTLGLLGIVLVPDVIAKTPPFVDRIIEASAADRQGIVADDLIIDINGHMTPSRREVEKQLSTIDRDSPVTITIQRGLEFHEFELRLIQSPEQIPSP